MRKKIIFVGILFISISIGNTFADSFSKYNKKDLEMKCMIHHGAYIFEFLIFSKEGTHIVYEGEYEFKNRPKIGRMPIMETDASTNKKFIFMNKNLGPQFGSRSMIDFLDKKLHPDESRHRKFLDCE